MINTFISTPVELLIACLKTVLLDQRFYKDSYPDEKQRLELKKIILTEKKKYRKANFVDRFLPVEVMSYIGDTPELDRYTKQGNTVVWTPTVYSQYYKSLNNTIVSGLSPNWYSLYFDHFDNEYQDIEPIKNFNCFINRMDVTRQSWLYLLLRRKIFDQGFVSYNMDVARLDNYDPSVTADQVFEQQFQDYMSIFSSEHELAKTIVPYRNFDSFADPRLIIMQSRFSIVLETYFHNNDEITFTEKTFRSLVLPRPWLLFCSKNAVATLRNWGFDLLDDLVDHSRYDNIDHAMNRQSVILDMAQEMLDFDVVKHQTRLHQAASYNLNLIKQWRQDLPELAVQDTKQLLDKVYEFYGAN